MFPISEEGERATRDRMPTIPCDLSEYARLHTGPDEELGDFFDEGLFLAGISPDEVTPAPLGSYEPAMFFQARTVDELTTDLLIDLWRTDVPRITTESATLVDDVEIWMLSMIDGRSSVGRLIERSGMGADDFLDRLCDLSARGVVTLDRSKRVVRIDEDM